MVVVVVFIRDNNSPWTALDDVRVSVRQYTVTGGEEGEG